MNSNAKFELIKVTTIKEIKNILSCNLEQYAIDQCLLAFDIDLTLTHPQHPAVCMLNMKKYSTVLEQITADLTSEQSDVMFNLSVMAAPLETVENDTTEIIRSLQQQGTKVIALTAGLVGAIRNVNNMEQWRFAQLKQLGLDFSQSFIDLQDITFTKLPNYRGNHPRFYKGILLANGGKGQSSKAATLIAFLNRVYFTPKLIVLVDDRRKILNEVAVILKEYNKEITFIGIEYTASSTYSLGEIEFEVFKNFWQNLASLAKQNF
jgi:hypothetical protein